MTVLSLLQEHMIYLVKPSLDKEEKFMGDKQ